MKTEKKTATKTAPKTPAKATKPTAKTPATKAPEKKPQFGEMRFAKDTKRYHALAITGKGFNGTIYVAKDSEVPKTLTLTFKAQGE
jgi:hypothetical protein